MGIQFCFRQSDVAYQHVTKQLEFGRLMPIFDVSSRFQTLPTLYIRGAGSRCVFRFSTRSSPVHPFKAPNHPNRGRPCRNIEPPLPRSPRHPLPDPFHHLVGLRIDKEVILVWNDLESDISTLLLQCFHSRGDVLGRDAVVDGAGDHEDGGSVKRVHKSRGGDFCGVDHRGKIDDAGKGAGETRDRMGDSSAAVGHAGQIDPRSVESGLGLAEFEGGPDFLKAAVIAPLADSVAGGHDREPIRFCEALPHPQISLEIAETAVKEEDDRQGVLSRAGGGVGEVDEAVAGR